MLGVIPSGSLWLIVLSIAAAAVLLCLRLIADVIGRETMIHDFKADMARKRINEAHRCQFVTGAVDRS